MERKIIIIIIFMQIYQTTSISYKNPSLNNSFILGSNLVNNSNISSPIISPNYYVDYSLEMNNWKTKGIYVEYTDPCFMNSFYYCSVYKGVSCGQQFLDLDSNFNNELYYQRFTFTDVQEYQLRVDWISEISFLYYSTGLSVYWNGVVIDSFYDSSCTLSTSTYYVKGKAGVNEVAFEGNGFMDSNGLMIRNIQLRQLAYSFPLSSNATNSSSNATANSTIMNSSNISNTSNTTNSSESINTTNLPNSGNSSNLTALNGTSYKNNISTTDQANNTLNDTGTSSNSSISQNNANSTNSSSLQANSTNSTNDTANNSSNNSIDNGTNNSTTKNTSTNSNTSEQTNTAINNTDIYSNTSNSTDFSGYSYSNYQSIYKFYNSSQYTNLLKIYNFATKYKAVTLGRSLFSSQQNLRFLVGFMMEFNHLVIYNYHIRNLTLMSNFILVSLQAFEEQKAYLTDKYIYPMLGTTPEMILYDFRNRIDLPTNPNNIGSELIKRPNGVLLEIADMFFVDVPATLITFLLGYVIFRLLFNFKISILFRQYSLMGLFFFILLNGKIQLLTFHFLSEILQFTSISSYQKFLMVIIVFFYFFIFTFSISLMIIYKSTYKKLVKFIYENCRQPLYSVSFMTFSFGLYNLALGFTHRLLVNYPQQQIFMLLFIEILYLIALISLIVKRFFENILLGISLFVMNLLRTSFIFTCLIFNLSSELQEELNQIQQYIFYSLLITWILSITLGLLEKIVVILKIAKHSLAKSIKNKNRVKPDNKIDNSIIKRKKAMGIIKDRKVQFQEVQQEQTRQINHFSIAIKSLKDTNSKKTVFTCINGFTRTKIVQTNTVIKQKTTVLVKRKYQRNNLRNIES